ncbi:MAG TPA: HD domain-containing protein [Candidatus Cybelea sp.]|nr:HD domain-containing protein [Candidatus Cybelea sp.]
MNRSEFLNACCAVAAITPAQGLPKSIAGVAIVDTPLALEATTTALAAEPPEIFNHSLRTFLFAELIARAKKIEHDAESVYVASILHDAGLSATYASPSYRFEVDGANLARGLAKRHGIPATRAETIWDAIALHDQGGLARWKSSEVVLVNAGVSADFGASLGALARDDVLAVLKAAPRTNFVPAFLQAVAAVAQRKPQATGNCFVVDVGYRMVPGFHLENFCDEVKTDPFAGYA